MKHVSYPFLEKISDLPRGAITDAVADALREAIVALQLKPGQAIVKSSVCEALDVSRFPVSEALTRLADEGLVSIYPQRGTEVSLLRRDELQEFLVMRSALEAEVARRIAPDVDDALLARLDENMFLQKRACAQEDNLAFFKLDSAFHDILYGALGYDRMSQMITRIRNNVERARRMLDSRRRIDDTLIEHEKIVQALRDRNPDEADAAMRAHIGSVMALLSRMADSQPDMFEQKSRLQK